MHTLYRSIVGRLLCTMRYHKKLIDVELEPCGLHLAQYRLLRYLKDHPVHSQAQIAEGLEVSPANIAVTLKTLEKNGYISKVPSHYDNRNNQIHLTDKAVSILDETSLCFDIVDNQMFAGFTEHELQQLYSYFDRMYHNLAQQQQTGKEHTL